MLIIVRNLVKSCDNLIDRLEQTLRDHKVALQSKVLVDMMIDSLKNIRFELELSGLSPLLGHIYPAREKLELHKVGILEDVFRQYFNLINQIRDSAKSYNLQENYFIEYNMYKYSFYNEFETLDVIILENNEISMSQFIKTICVINKTEFLSIHNNGLIHSDIQIKKELVKMLISTFKINFEEII